jgi:glutamate 5-kinase
MNYQYKRITVKVGSNVLARPDGTLDVTRLSALVDQIAILHKEGVQVVLVSSGAVASGRSELSIQRKLDGVDQRQLFSAVGQAKLINRYFEFFREHNIAVGQVLATKESFSTRRHYLNQRNCMRVMLENGVIPIVNENDTVSVSELMFTDNDELSGLIASMVDAEALIILSNIDGVYDGPLSDSKSKVIRKVEPGKDLSHYVQTQKSNFGRGGMLTKSTIARKIADEGITVHIANGKKENILLSLVKQPENTLSTCFVPANNGVSSVKKWIAHSEDFARGALYLNPEASQLLADSDTVVSLLPVGIVKAEGSFEKDDIVHIKNAEGELMGVGKVAFDVNQVCEMIGKRGLKPVVHYDYLYIE